MNGRGKLLFWVGLTVATALVAMFALAGVAAAQVSGVDNVSEECTDGSCNSGNVAEVDVDNDCIIAAIGVGILDGGDLIINDACNTDVTVTQSQVFEEVTPAPAPAPVAVAPAAVAAAPAAKIPVTGVEALALGLLGSGLTASGLVIWRRSR